MKTDLLLTKLSYYFRVLLFIIMLLVFTAGAVSSQEIQVLPGQYVCAADNTVVRYVLDRPDAWVQYTGVNHPEIRQAYDFNFIQASHKKPQGITIPIKYESAILPVNTEVNPSRKKKYIMDVQMHGGMKAA